MIGIVQCVLLIFICIFIIVYLKFIYFPKKAIQKKKIEIQTLGYKVHVIPFAPFLSGWKQALLRNFDKYGDAHYSYKLPEATEADIILHNLFHYVVVEVVNPDLMKDFLKPQNVYYQQKVIIPFENMIETFGGNGIIFSQGLQWKRKRAILNSVFTFDFMKAAIPIIVKNCNEQFQLFEKKYRANNNISNPETQNKFNLTLINVYSEIFVNVITQIFFGKQATKQKINGQQFASFAKRLIGDIALQGYGKLGMIFGHWVYKLGLTASDRDLFKRRLIFKSISYNFVKNRKKQIEQNGFSKLPTDIIEVLMKSAKISDNKQHQKFDFEQLASQFGIFTVAGSDTTSINMTSMTYFIILNPNVEKKIRKIIEQHIKSDEDIVYEKIKDLKYLDWTINQTLRFVGATPLFFRWTTKDHLIGKIPSRKGQIWTAQFVPNHFNPKYYKNPHEFRPQRWQQETKQIPSYAFSAFSGGPRACIGKQIAQFNLKVTLIKFFQRYEKITLPIDKIKFKSRFLYEPEIFDSQVIKKM